MASRLGKPLTVMKSPMASWKWLTTTLLTLAICPSAMAKTSPLSVTPSDKWYGNAGLWSAVSIKVGGPEQELDVMVSTSSSDISVVASTACNTEACSIERGSTFNISQSSTWKTQGKQSLGIDTVLGENIDGIFGTDTLTYATSGISIKNTVIGVFNSTDFWLGFYGVGMTSETGNAASAATCPISQLVETMSDIPSHSYGYTAGASYRNYTPNSLVLGGMDTRRYVNNSITFALDSTKQQPSAYINSMNLVLPNGSALPANWLIQSPEMIDAGQMITVLIDSSTPYLWLPEEVCENFASALNLTYNSTLNLYTFDQNPSQHTALQDLNFSISIQLAAKPSSLQAVTIDLPYQSFDQQMTYPDGKYYFPLKRAMNDSQYMLGRTFLQEAYLIVDYERGNFSVHQALFPSDTSTNTTGITEITRPSDSSFTGPNSGKGASMPIATRVGIAVGGVALVALLIIANFYRIRYNRLKAAQNPQLAVNRSNSKASMMLAKLNIGKRQSSNGSQRATVYETDGRNTAHPIEVGADATHERFEMEVPMSPVELDSGNSGIQFSGIAANGTQISQLSEYEREQLKLHYAMQRQNIETSFPEKSDINGHESGTYRSEHSTVSAESTMLSDLSPSSTSHLMGSITSPVSPIYLRDPPPSYQRHVSTSNMIPEGAEIVCAGSIPYISPGMEVGFLPDSRAGLASLGFSGLRLGEGSVRDTLGSNFTVEETMGMGMDGDVEIDREHEAMMSPGGLERSLDGQDLVHVPQVATRKYSWESGA